jgi:uncharacterized protein DUF2272
VAAAFAHFVLSWVVVRLPSRLDDGAIRGSPLMRGVPLLLLVPLVACAGPSAPRTTPVNEHIPPFARVPYEPLSRNAVVAIALREWRLFGSPVDDSPPGTYRPTTPEDKAERQQGLWERVGEYWWEGLNPGDPDVGWTGKHDGNGIEFLQPRTEPTLGRRPSYPMS